MTLNVTVASPRVLISCSDRRLTNTLTGGIITEQSTKLTQLVCKDALALIAYNGIGRFQGESPAQWLLKLDQRVHLTDLPFKEVLQAIREECDSRIANIANSFERRHTFVLGA
jgi:hypothetical protein